VGFRVGFTCCYKRETSRTVASITNLAGEATAYQYDPNGNATHKTDTTGGTSQRTLFRKFPEKSP